MKVITQVLQNSRVKDVSASILNGNVGVRLTVYTDAHTSANLFIRTDDSGDGLVLELFEFGEDVNGEDTREVIYRKFLNTQ